MSYVTLALIVVFVIAALVVARRCDARTDQTSSSAQPALGVTTAARGDQEGLSDCDVIEEGVALQATREEATNGGEAPADSGSAAGREI